MRQNCRSAALSALSRRSCANCYGRYSKPGSTVISRVSSSGWSVRRSLALPVRQGCVDRDLKKPPRIIAPRRPYSARAERSLPNCSLEDGSAMLDKTYQPSAVEARRYALWERSGGFAADPDSGKPPYTIMMPPPNVTGSLHMGHALTFTLQDVLVRYQRMRGCDVLWQPGTDHAGIATEIIVTNQLAEEAKSKQELGRDRFVARVWEWKEQSEAQLPVSFAVSADRRIGAERPL